MMLLPIRKTLKDATLVELDDTQPEEQAAVRTLFNTIILDGQTYPQTQPLSEQEFAVYWMSGDTFVVRVVNESTARAQNTGRLTQSPGQILGAFYLKPNFPGRSSHICNAGFIVQPSMQGQGIGRFMGESMLAIARAKGYTAVMFNLIFAHNLPSINLWKSLNFSTVGTIPKAVCFADGRVMDAVIMYRAL